MKLLDPSGSHEKAPSEPDAWKAARIAIPKPGKLDYSKARAYRVIALLNSLGTVVERVEADLIADSLDQLMAATREVHARKEYQWKCKWPPTNPYPQQYQGPDAPLHHGQYDCRKRRPLY